MKQIKECNEQGCHQTHYARGWCRSHYRTKTKEQSRRFAKIKSDPIRYRAYLDYQKIAHKKYVIDYKKHADTVYYNGNREKAIERDLFKCVFCGMTRKEHRQQFGKDLNVHHIDEMGHGVYKKQRNSDLNNLLTVCVRCHTLIHNGKI